MTDIEFRAIWWRGRLVTYSIVGNLIRILTR
jgi:hypothetical protein